MKSLSSPIATLLTALSLTLLPLSAHSATSDPVGAMTVTINAGNVPVSPCFVHPISVQGSVDSVSLSGEELTVNLSSALLQTSQFDEGLYPKYYIEVVSTGAYQGMYFDVISNTSSSIKVLTWTGTEQPFSAGSSFLVRKHMSLGDFFDDAKDSLLPYADSIKVFYPGNLSKTLFWDGSMWTSDFATNESDHPIYPGQGFLTAFGSQKSFVVHGSVKTTPTQVPVYSGDINFVGTMSPVDRTFTALGTTNWMSPYADSFKLFVADGSLNSTATVFSDGSNMTNFVSNFDNYNLAAASAFLLAPASDINWVQPAAY